MLVKVGAASPPPSTASGVPVSVGRPSRVSAVSGVSVLGASVAVSILAASILGKSTPGKSVVRGTSRPAKSAAGTSLPARSAWTSAPVGTSAGVALSALSWLSRLPSFFASVLARPSMSSPPSCDTLRELRPPQAPIVPMRTAKSASLLLFM